MSSANPKILTIMLASIRPQNLSQLFYNLQETADDPQSFEVLVKIDEGDDKMREYMEMAQESYSLDIRFLQTPKEDGYYTLHHGYQALWEASNPESYFSVVFNDEVRFATKGWDTILKKYVGFYKDDVFRLKVSQQKLRNYYSVYECGPCPDNYPITTRRWMELAEGIGDCWGPDVWHQMIDYHLGMHSPPHAEYFRSVPIHEIKIVGEEAGQQLSQKAIATRTIRIHQEWWRVCSVRKQQQIRRLAAKIQAYLWARKEAGERFSIAEDKRTRGFHVVRYGEMEDVIGMFPYYLSPLAVSLYNFKLLVRCARGHLGHVPYVMRGFIIPAGEPRFFLLKYFSRSIRLCVVFTAYLMALLVPGQYSRLRNPFIHLGLWLNHMYHRSHYRLFLKLKGKDWVYNNYWPYRKAFVDRMAWLLSFDIENLSEKLVVDYSQEKTQVKLDKERQAA